MRLIYCLLTGCLLSFYGDAQTDSKKFEHYVGVQVNKLLKEVISLSSGSIVNDNPYFINYSIINSASGYGLNAGFGLDYSKSEDAENPDGRLLESNDVNYKVGICRRISLTSRCELNFGVDLVGEFNQTKSYSNSVIVSGNFLDSSYFQTTNLTKSIGGGLSAAFHFYISKRILAGTEASYYVWSSKEKMHSLVYTHNESFFTNTNSIEVQNSASKDLKVKIELPVAIFIIFKF